MGESSDLVNCWRQCKLNTQRRPCIFYDFLPCALDSVFYIHEGSLEANNYFVCL